MPFKEGDIAVIISTKRDWGDEGFDGWCKGLLVECVSRQNNTVYTCDYGNRWVVRAMNPEEAAQRYPNRGRGHNGPAGYNTWLAFESNLVPANLANKPAFDD